jgi:hypothetical protein
MIVPVNSIGNVTFQLRLLLSGDLRIEVLLGNELVDSYSFFVEVPAPETDVGILMIEMVQTEITAVGVTLAALAIFAATYMQAKNKWLDEKLKLVESLEKQQRKFSGKEKRIMECASFLLRGKYNECLRHFLHITTIKKTLSPIMNLEKEEKKRSNFENVKKSTIGIAFVLLIAASFGFIAISIAPIVVDLIFFLYPTIGGRDILISLFFVPLFSILLFGIFWMIFENYWEELGKIRRSLFILSGVVPFLVAIAFYTILFIFFFILGFLTATGLTIIFHFVLKYKKRQERKVLFQRELFRIQQLKGDLQKMRERSSARFEREEKNLRQGFSEELNQFEFAFKLIKENMTSKLQEIEAKRSFDLVSEKRYEQLHKRFNSIAENAEKIISEISAQTNFYRNDA